MTVAMPSAPDIKRFPFALKDLFIVAFLSFLWISCEKATPIPAGKEAFVGTWKSNSGFTIQIKANGTADLSHNLNQRNPDYDKLCVKVGPPVITNILVQFKGDNTLEVFKPTLYKNGFCFSTIISWRWS